MNKTSSPREPAEILDVGGARIAALPALAAPLLGWYGRARRDLPWRREPAPYRVWVSEIMLQQTRVEAVRGHYARFIAALPGVRELAGVSEDALLKLWEGLGYYSRARNLRRAARVVMAEYGGALPASYELLRTLPGIGEYTAGAIASIAFGIAVPAVDGNVLRVLSRILASGADVSQPAVRKAMRELAFSMLPENKPGDLNQALMELGATVCLPNGNPLCGRCPVADACAGYRAGTAALLPVLPAKKARRVEDRTIVFVRARGKLLLFRRGKGLLAGMYEPLNLRGRLSGEEAADAVRALGGDPVGVTRLADAKHVFTHIEWNMRGYNIDCGEFFAVEGVWGDAREYAIPSAFKGQLTIDN